MGEFFATVWDKIVIFFNTYHWLRDTVDILIVALAIFSIFRLIRDSRTEQLLKGVLLLLAAYVVASLLHLTAIKYVMDFLFDNALILLAIIFQPELRRVLESAGHSRLGVRNFFGVSAEQEEQLTLDWKQAINAVCEGASMLQRQKMGALIVLERSTKLGEIISSGTVIDATASAELIGNIFFNKAPLHDGAMIIRDGKVCAAGCFLPLSDNLQISRELGTRHRAGVGMSENSDAVVVIVSEETGVISLAVAGELKRNFSVDALRVALENAILWNCVRQDMPENKRFAWLRRWFSK